MKKLFLFLSLSVLTLSISSCSDDDSSSTDNATSYVKFKADGIQKTYSNIIINTETVTSGEQEEIWLTVTGSEAGNSEEYISFEVLEGEVGADVIYDPASIYYTNGQMYYGWIMNQGTSISNVIQINDTEKLKGTFSGSFRKYDAEDNLISIEITEGSFDINR